MVTFIGPPLPQLNHEHYTPPARKSNSMELPWRSTPKNSIVIWEPNSSPPFCFCKNQINQDDPKSYHAREIQLEYFVKVNTSTRLNDAIYLFENFIFLVRMRR